MEATARKPLDPQTASDDESADGLDVLDDLEVAAVCEAAQLVCIYAMH